MSTCAAFRTRKVSCRQFSEHGFRHGRSSVVRLLSVCLTCLGDWIPLELVATDVAGPAGWACSSASREAGEQSGQPWWTVSAVRQPLGCSETRNQGDCACIRGITLRLRNRSWLPRSGHPLSVAMRLARADYGAVKPTASSGLSSNLRRMYHNGAIRSLGWF